MTEITTLGAKPLDLPLDAPFEISLGTKTRATNILVVVRTESGTRGYGEGSPIPAVTGETQSAALETATATRELVEGQPIGEYRRLIEEVRTTFPGMASATFAVETALLDAFCREKDIAMSELYGGQPAPVETDLTIPILSQSDAHERAVGAVDAGFTHLKIKTGTDVDEDVSRVEAVRDAAPDAALTVDANQGWSPKETYRFASRIESLGIDLSLIEQPVPAANVEGLADVRHRVDIPIAADEAVFTPEDATRIVREHAADVINVKLGKSGPLASAAIVSIAKGAGLDLMIGCMLESAIGIHASAHLVAGSGAFSYVDLDGNRLLAEDVIPTAAGPVHDITGPGHGVTPNFDL
jgi:L-alanine-DL-glutamate epimerase-like enolase superfamily enzyme